MSWLRSARVAIDRWGSPSRFAIRQIVSLAFPGGSIAVDLLDKLLAAAEETSKELADLEEEARAQASEAELRRVGEVLDEVNDRLSGLVEQVTIHEGSPGSRVSSPASTGSRSRAARSSARSATATTSSKRS